VNIEYLVNGKKYNSIEECYTANQDIARCSLSMFYQRIRGGMSAEEALTTPAFASRKKYYFKVEGVQYYLIKDIAKAYNLPMNTVYKRFSRGKTGDDLIPETKRKNYVKPGPKKKEEHYRFFVNGVEYKSTADACRKNNVLFITFRKRMEYGWSRAEALGIEKRIDGRAKRTKRKTFKRIKVKAHGKVYKSIGLLAKEYNIPDYILRGRIKQGYTPEEAIKKIKFTGKKVVVAGKTYDSISKAAQKYNKSPEAVQQLIKTGRSLEQALGLEIYFGVDTVEYKGKKYKNLKHLSKEINFPFGLLRSRTNYGGMSVSDAIKLGKEKILSEGRYNIKVLKRDSILASKLASLYLVSIIINGNEKHKIGITTRNAKDRLSQEGNEFKIIKEIKLPLLKCYTIEQKLLKTYSSYRDKSISADSLDGYTEIFSFPKYVVGEIIEKMESKQ